MHLHTLTLKKRLMTKKVCCNLLVNFRKAERHTLCFMSRQRSVESFKLLHRENFNISIMTNTSNHSLIKCIIPLTSNLEVLQVYLLKLEIRRGVKVVLIMNLFKKQEHETQVLFVKITLKVTSSHLEIYFREIMTIGFKIILKKWGKLILMN